MGGTGLELSALTPSKIPVSSERGAKSGALFYKNDPDLAKLIEVWPTLTKSNKAKIMDLIEKHSSERKSDHAAE